MTRHLAIQKSVWTDFRFNASSLERPAQDGSQDYIIVILVKRLSRETLLCYQITSQRDWVTPELREKIADCCRSEI